jgi:hypothetical protein
MTNDTVEEVEASSPSWTATAFSAATGRGGDLLPEDGSERQNRRNGGLGRNPKHLKKRQNPNSLNHKRAHDLDVKKAPRHGGERNTQVTNGLMCVSRATAHFLSYLADNSSGMRLRRRDRLGLGMSRLLV